MSATDYRALCAALLDEIPHESPTTCLARAALAQPEPEGPTQAEAVALYSEVMAVHDCQTLGEMAEHFSHAVLTRWGRPAIEPVPVSERLPEPGDVNDDGEVWVEEPPYDYALGDTGDYDSEPGRWVLRPLSSLDKRDKRRWLPHHALPVPVSEPPPDRVA